MGAASEKAFLNLTDAYETALNTTDAGSFRSAIDGERGIKRKHQRFMNDWYDKRIKPALKQAQMNTDWISRLDSALEFVFHYFRTNRNDAGHPTGVTQSREELHASLLVFPSYLQVVYELMDWMSSIAPL